MAKSSQIKHPAFGKRHVPLGRLTEWRLNDRPDADRIAFHAHGKIDGGIAFEEYTAHAYPDRASMLDATRAAARESNRPTVRPLIRDNA